MNGYNRVERKSPLAGGLMVKISMSKKNIPHPPDPYAKFTNVKVGPEAGTRWLRKYAERQAHVRRRAKRNSYLTKFWQQFNRAHDEQTRLKLLTDVAESVVRKNTKQGWEEDRGCFDRKKNRKYPLDGLHCRVCSKPAELRHHIIQVQYGGDNGPYNIVPLCHACHTAIHPHLKGKGNAN
jgi:hypothetical protein